MIDVDSFSTPSVNAPPRGVAWWRRRGRSSLPLICTAFVIGFLLALVASGAFGRDLGQWKDQDPQLSKWFQELRQPDNPTVPCCGEADAYWADQVEVKDGQVIATITDERDDAPLGRPHVPVGTKIVVPNNKLKWDRGNPTGHTVIFLSYSREVYCFVQNGGV